MATENEDDLPPNFRYVLKVTNDNRAFIMFKYLPDGMMDSEIAKCQETSESNILIDYTIDHSIRNTPNRILEFMKDVKDFIIQAASLTNRNKLDLIKVYNFQDEVESGILFPVETTREIFTHCNKLKVNLEDCGMRISAIVLDDSIEEIHWENGSWVADNCSIRADKMKFVDCLFRPPSDIENSVYCNLICTEKLTMIDVFAHTMVKMNLLGNPTDEAKFDNSEISIINYDIFGAEVFNNDFKEPRLEISKFNKSIIDEFNIHDEVVYGNIIRASKTTTFVINTIIRNFSQVLSGDFCVVHDIGKLVINKCKITIDNSSPIKKDSGIINIIPDERGLDQEVKLYDAEIINRSPNSIYYLKVKGTTLKKLYIYNCNFDRNVECVNLEDSKNFKVHITRIENCTFDSDKDIIFNNETISIAASIFVTTGDIKLLSNTSISIDNNSFNCKNMYFNSTNKPISTISSTDNIFKCKKILLDNVAAKDCTKFFDTRSDIDCKIMTIKGYDAMFDSSFFKIEEMNIHGHEHKILSCKVLFNEFNKSKLFINAYSPFVDNFIFVNPFDVVTKGELHFKYTNYDEDINSEHLTFTALDKGPQIFIHTSKPIRTEVSGFDSNSTIHYSAFDLFTDRTHKIETIPSANNAMQTNLEDINPTIVNDSEKLLLVERKPNDYKGFYYTFTPK